MKTQKPLLIPCFILAALILPSFVFAVDHVQQNVITTVSAKEITDENAIVSKLKKVGTRKLSQDISKREDEKGFISESYEYDQILSSRLNLIDGTVTEEHILYHIEYVIPEEDYHAGDSQPVFAFNPYVTLAYAAGGSKSTYSHDKTKSVKFTVTVHYTEKIVSGVSNKTLTRVAGSYTIEQSGVQVTKQSLLVAQNPPAGITKKATYTPTTSSYSYAISGWPAIPDATEVFGATQGATISYTLKKGTSSWTGSHTTRSIG